MIKPMTKPVEKPKTVTLKSVAQQVGLSPGTISLVLNRAPQSHAIPQHTQERIFAANLPPRLATRLAAGR